MQALLIKYNIKIPVNSRLFADSWNLASTDHDAVRARKIKEICKVIYLLYNLFLIFRYTCVSIACAWWARMEPVISNHQLQFYPLLARSPINLMCVINVQYLVQKFGSVLLVPDSIVEIDIQEMTYVDYGFH